MGGAVRDHLLGRPVGDRDWLVLGPCAEEMSARGFRPVGRDFTVFLHPDTGEEYALPRGEAPDSAPIEAQVIADLWCRDLTVNAIAMDAAGKLLDPCDGVRDLRQRRLRHTPYFADDPLRALRLARFHARYLDLGFVIDESSQQLVQSLIASGALDALPPERIYRELSMGLSLSNPADFVRSLRQLGLLGALLPEVECLFGVPQPLAYHPEIDTGEHQLLALQRIAELAPIEEWGAAPRFAVLFHDLGKGLTPADQWPRHIGHEEAGVEPLKRLATRLTLPNEVRELSLLACRYHLLAHRAPELRPARLLTLFEQLDALRRPQRFEQFLLVCQADAQGREGFDWRPYPQGAYLRRQLATLRQLDEAAIARACADPAQIPQRIRQLRIAQLRPGREEEYHRRSLQGGDGV